MTHILLNVNGYSQTVLTYGIMPVEGWQLAVSEGKRNQTIVMDKDIYEAVNNMAWEERRSFSNMTNMLLREVLKARGVLKENTQK